MQAGRVILLIILAALMVAALIYYVTHHADAGTLDSVQRVRLNEVMSSNKGAVPDEYGAYPDYVELYNAAAEPVESGARLRFTIRYRRDGAARPQEFVGLIAGWAGADAAMRRLERVRIRWKGSPAALPRAGRSVSQ